MTVRGGGGRRGVRGEGFAENGGMLQCGGFGGRNMKICEQVLINWDDAKMPCGRRY